LLVLSSTALGLSGCGSFGLDQKATVDSADTDAPGVFIQAITPNFGPISGDTSVNIIGEGFGVAPIVTWGTTLADVEAATDTLLVVRTPAAAAPGVVDVTVASEAGSYTLQDAYTFTPVGDTTDPTDTGGGGPGGTDTDVGGDGGADTEDTGTPPAEGTGALVQISYTYNLCPDCFIPPNPEETASAVAAFFDPVDVDFLDYLPAIGACATGVGPPDRGLNYLDAGAFTYLRSGSRLINLYQTVDGSKITYAASSADSTMAASDIAHSAAYDLSTGGGSDITNFELEDAAYTAQFFDDLSPDTSSMWGYKLSRTQPTTWTWAPTGTSGGHFVIIYEFYNASGSYLGASVCHGNDTGVFSAPASAVIAGAGSYVILTFARFETGTSPMPDGLGDIFYMSVASVMSSAQVKN